MKRWITAIVVLLLCGMLCACRETPTVIHGDNDPLPTQEDTFGTNPTVAVPDGQMRFTTLMKVASAQMKWSSIADYTHTDIDDTHASFVVTDANTGNTCTLLVTYDAATDTVSEAIASCGDTAVSVLSDSTEPLRKISVAMNEK